MGGKQPSRGAGRETHRRSVGSYARRLSSLVAAYISQCRGESTKADDACSEEQDKEVDEVAESIPALTAYVADLTAALRNDLLSE